MRKSSVQLVSQTSEPLIVVDESGEPETCTDDKSSDSSSEESPTTHFQNQFLLSPYRDARETRKLSLPSPQCSGITASQVRRLSERSEVGGPGPRQTEFLATLSQAPAPTPGGRRHSVVTISKVPPAFFGRNNRRESVAAFPNRVLSARRESMTGPPSTEPRGSVHNLQLDIMDDIVQSRKVRMKLWNTSSEKVCELKDESGAVQKYTGNRRYSEFVGTTLAPIPSGSAAGKRRASELPPLPSAAARKHVAPGIVCSNTDLISILSNLTSSATEIDQQHQQAQAPTTSGALSSCRADKERKGWEQRRARLRTNRSNSFDASVLHKAQPSEWFAKRHQPMAAKTQHTPPIKTTFVEEMAPRAAPAPPCEQGTKQERDKVLWDEKAGAVVDAQVLGNAIEDFLRRDSQLSLTSLQTSPKSPKKSSPQTSSVPPPAKPKGWFGASPPDGATNTTSHITNEEGEEGATGSTCDSSICSTLKDLFVK